MPKIDSNQILLLGFFLVLLAGGTYLTYVRQERTLEELDQKIEAKEEALQEIQNLQNERAQVEANLRTLRTAWSRQFKLVPETLNSADLIAYLTTNTRTGFKTFDVESKGRNSKGGYSTYTFGVEGKAYFTSLYRLVWKMENRRSFYRVRNLELDYLEERTTDEEEERTTMDIVVSFRMDVQAIYGLAPGLDADNARQKALMSQAQVAQANADISASLPTDVLPDPIPRINPFYPLIFEQVPPNEKGRLNVETAQFISIVDGQAVFEAKNGVKRLEEGDRVYLGRILEINSSEGLLRARLNRGGVIDYVERYLNPTSPLQQVGSTNETP